MKIEEAYQILNISADIKYHELNKRYKTILDQLIEDKKQGLDVRPAFHKYEEAYKLIQKIHSIDSPSRFKFGLPFWQQTYLMEVMLCVTEQWIFYRCKTGEGAREASSEQKEYDKPVWDSIGPVGSSSPTSHEKCQELFTRFQSSFLKLIKNKKHNALFSDFKIHIIHYENGSLVHPDHIYPECDNKELKQRGIYLSTAEEKLRKKELKIHRQNITVSEAEPLVNDALVTLAAIGQTLPSRENHRSCRIL